MATMNWSVMLVLGGAWCCMSAATRVITMGFVAPYSGRAGYTLTAPGATVAIERARSEGLLNDIDIRLADWMMVWIHRCRVQQLKKNYKKIIARFWIMRKKTQKRKWRKLLLAHRMWCCKVSNVARSGKDANNCCDSKITKFGYDRSAQPLLDAIKYSMHDVVIYVTLSVSVREAAIWA